MINNPFDITKAVDYTDDEIYKYWVDIDYENHGFEMLIKPDTLMPMIVVGSKGSGKTHIMKYFSYELQKIRCKAQSGSMQKGLEKEKFIGIYIRCSGFNSDKFSGKGVDSETWSCLHSYFWELWVGERLVDVLIDLKQRGLLTDINESEIVHDILSMFLKDISDIDTFEALNDYILGLQKDLDYQVQNFKFMGQDKPKVEILLNTPQLTYNIPELLKKKIPFFKNKYILYLIDELENFSAEQQRLIQTLIREKPAACTFRVGTRPYGIRTLKTLKDVEENHEGSEFDSVILDEFLRNYGSYTDYITNILENRLRNSGIVLSGNIKLSDLIEEQNNDDVIEKLAARKGRESRSYLNTFRANLNKLKLNEGQIAFILENIICRNDILIERTSVMLMYKAIKDNKNNVQSIMDESIRIRKSADAYLKDKNKDTLHFTKLDKYKQDIIDSLAREGNVEIPYNGLNKLIELSCGTPRTILRLLKAAFNNQYFNTGQVPFEDGRKLSVKSQQAGIESTYEWFFEENRIPSAEQTRATDAVTRLGNYFRSARFSDLPPQCSINIFSLNVSELSNKAKSVFELLLSYSYIVQLDVRRLINSDNKVHTYRLNSILSPKYELALSKRGNISFSATDAEVFFNLDKKDAYDSFVAKKLKGYNFPFGNSEEQQLDMFES